MTKILITGASGYLGARLFHGLRSGFEVLGTYNSTKLYKDFVKLEITNQSEVTSLIKKIQPNVIIHAAAKSNGGWCNENKEEAFKNNVEATKYFANVAKEVGSKLIFISSYAAINPSETYTYGQSKKLAENYIKSGSEDYLIIRPNLIVGYSPRIEDKTFFGQIIKSLDKNIKEKYNPVRKYQPTYIRQLLEILVEVINQNLKKETIPVAVEEIKTRFEIARDILSPFGIKAYESNEGDFPLVEDDLNKLKKLSLPRYSYEQIIQSIIYELNHRDKFVL